MPQKAEIFQDKSIVLTEKERKEFKSLFPQLLQELTQIPEYMDMAQTNLWMAEVLDYNVPHGKHQRGLATVLAYKCMAKELSQENIRLSFVLGWCIEIFQGCCLVADDIMDGSKTRRGRPCWYQKDSLGVTAFNDALLLESVVHVLLKMYFKQKDCYKNLRIIFNDVRHKTVYGQSLDTAMGMERNIELFTMDRYSAIVKYKTSYYTFYLAVRLAMAMAGINDPEIIKQMETVTLEIGHLFQVQDDYLDCFGNPKITGKIGTDIQDYKCSWLFVTALEKCSPEKKQLLIDNYGQHDPEKVKRVKDIYEELGLPSLFRDFEDATYLKICRYIQNMSETLPKSLFFDMVNITYRRDH